MTTKLNAMLMVEGTPSFSGYELGEFRRLISNAAFFTLADDRRNIVTGILCELNDSDTRLSKLLEFTEKFDDVELSPDQMRELFFKSAYEKKNGATIINPRKFIHLVKRAKPAL